MPRSAGILGRLAATLAFALLCVTLRAQDSLPQVNRVPDHPDLRLRAALPGQLPPWVSPDREAGAAPEDTVVGLTLVLRRSPERQDAFERMLAGQTNPGSPLYHHWLNPAEIGEQFGPSQHDVSAVVDWLRASGLQVKPVAGSRLFVEAYGPAPVVAAALGTSFHLYRSDAGPRLSASSDPVVPRDLAPVIGSIAGLAQTDLQPQSHAEPPASNEPSHGGISPQYTSAGGNHYLFPADFATIFDINPLYAVGINGAGQRVAVIGRSDVFLSDIAAFEARSGLPANMPNVIVASTGVDPGVVLADEGESDLDLQRVIGVAPGVQADFVISGSANGYNGIYVAAQYEVQTVMDPVLTMSYGGCERNAGASGVALWSNLFSQAAAEGITVFVSSGDSGAAFCDTQFATPPATQFLSVNYICSNPYTTCVGGTELADTGNPSRYWSTGNSAMNESALGYIPEGGWNDPSTTNANTGVTTYYARASTGGASVFVSKPAYQAGTGVPNDGHRDLPDVAFPASYHDGYAGCEADITAFNGDCSTNNGLVIFYGTSAAAPGWAGVTALLNQRTNSRQGNLNPAIYRLAATPANNAFHDVTPATTGLALCDVTIPSLCNNSVPSPTSLSGGQAGYPVQTGYDQVTGWGSADVASFVAAAILPYQPTAITVAASQNPVQAGQAVVFTASVSTSAGGTPTGTVQFLSGSAVLASAQLTNSLAASPALSFASAGTYSITAVYSGDLVYQASTSVPLSLVVTPGPSLLVNVTPAALTLDAGAGSGNSVAILYTSTYGLAGTVSASCTVAPQAGVTPALLPTCTVGGGGTLAAGGTASGVLTIGTVAPHAAVARQPRVAGLAFPCGGALAALACLLLPCGRRRLPRVAALLCVLACLGVLDGCGKGNFTTSTLVGGTTPGSYTVTVAAAAGGVNGSAQVALTVQ